MIYLQDISYRVIYSIIAISLSIIYLYFTLNDFIFIFTLPSLNKYYIIDSFIFTEPKEIFLFKIFIGFFYLLNTLIPYVLILAIDFIKAGLYKNEWLKIKKFQTISLNLYYIFSILSFFIFLPIFWSFFISLSVQQSLTNYFFELSALNYFYFLFSTHFSLILACFFFICCCFSIYLFGINLILNFKKYIIIIFLLFSTIITPPDLEFQIFLFLSLYICLEILFFILFLKYFYFNYFLIKKVTS